MEIIIIIIIVEINNINITFNVLIIINSAYIAIVST